jgi:hypothetical protein
MGQSRSDGVLNSASSSSMRCSVEEEPSGEPDNMPLASMAASFGAVAACAQARRGAWRVSRN